MRFKSILACAALAPAPIAASQPLRLQPSSPWVVDYAENSCRLIRKFGSGDAEATLIFESEGPGQLDMLVLGKPLKTGEEEVTARFLPVQQEPYKGMSVESKDKDTQAGALFNYVQLLPDAARAAFKAKREQLRAHPHDRPPPLDLAEERERKAQRQEFAAKATAIEVNARRGHPIVLETGSMGKAIKSFDECLTSSLKAWGIDPALEDKIVRPVWLQNRTGFIGPNDYPPAMLVRGQQSDVKVRVLVDASGRVTKCTALSYFKFPEFMQLVCNRISSMAKFAPAELADGTKVPSYYAVHIMFRIGP